MTLPADAPVLDPAVAARHRAMPLTRLTDCGMNAADARALHARTERFSLLAGGDARRELAGNERVGVGLEGPSDAVLDLLGRMPLVEDLREEELDKAT